MSSSNSASATPPSTNDLSLDEMTNFIQTFMVFREQYEIYKEIDDRLGIISNFIGSPVPHHIHFLSSRTYHPTRLYFSFDMHPQNPITDSVHWTYEDPSVMCSGSIHDDIQRWADWKDKRKYIEEVRDKNILPRSWTQMPSEITKFASKIHDFPSSNKDLFRKLGESSVYLVLEALKYRLPEESLFGYVAPTRFNISDEILLSDEDLPKGATYDGGKLFDEIKAYCTSEGISIDPSVELQHRARFDTRFVNPAISQSHRTVFIRSEIFPKMFVYMDLPNGPKDSRHGRFGYRVVDQPETYDVEISDVDLRYSHDLIKAMGEANPEEPELAEELMKLAVIAEKSLMDPDISMQSRIINTRDWMKEIQAERERIAGQKASEGASGATEDPQEAEISEAMNSLSVHK